MGSGWFALSIDFGETYSGWQRVLTSHISYNASATMAQEDSDSNYAGSGSGESLQSKLQALPHVGRVHVSRYTLNAEKATYKWQITFLDFIGDVPQMKVLRTSFGGEGNSIVTRTTVDGSAYVLKFVMQGDKNGIEKGGGQGRTVIGASVPFRLVD